MSTQSSEHRHWAHHPANWAAIITDAKGGSTAVRVIGSCHEGLGLTGCPTFHAGQLIDVALADIGCFPCRVMWQSDSQCDVEFLEALDETSLYFALLLSEPSPANGRAAEQPKVAPSFSVATVSGDPVDDNEPKGDRRLAVYEEHRAWLSDLAHLVQRTDALSRDLQAFQTIAKGIMARLEP